MQIEMCVGELRDGVGNELEGLLIDSKWDADSDDRIFVTWELYNGVAQKLAHGKSISRVEKWSDRDESDTKQEPTFY